MKKTWQQRADAALAQGCVTYSRRNDQFIRGVMRTHVKHGEGAYLTLDDGRKVIDHTCGLGSNILSCMNNYGLPTTDEVVLAEMIKKRFPFIDKLKLCKTGSDACMAAVRIARSFKQNGRTCENLQRLWEKETIIRISQGRHEGRWLSSELQNMREDLSIRPKGGRNKTPGTEEILQNRKRELDGEEVRPSTTQTSAGSEQGPSSLHCQEVLCTGTMFNLWKKSRDTSSGLSETFACDLVVPKASCRSAQGYGVGLGYHGHSNTFISAEHPGVGCIDEKYVKVNTLEDVILFIEWAQGLVDYVIIEPVMLDIDVKPLLQRLRDLCSEHDIVLIFDEIITGLRTPDYCFANYFGIEPDIICLGKAMGNGFPISCVGGKAKYMDTPGYFISSTFAGDHASIRAAIGTLTALTPKRVRDLWKLGEWFQQEFNRISPRVQLYGLPTRAVWKGTEEDKALFMQEMYRLGVLYGKAWWISHSHGRKLLEMELKAAKEVFKKIELGKVKLEGLIPVEIFKRN